MRFLSAYLAQKEGCWTITGSERMKNRPIRILVDALKQLGADMEYLEKEGFPPLKIKGRKLQGGKISLDGSVSSQYISALMMIAPAMSEGLTITLTGNVVSMPYIRMTSRMMRDFGIEVEWNEKTIRISPQLYVPCTYTVEADWSAASYWYEVVSLCNQTSGMELSGLFEESLQGDSKVSWLFEKLGVCTEFIPGGIKIVNNCPVHLSGDRYFEYDFVNEPDLAQTFVVTCALKNIPFRFSGLQSLRIKETDRISALQKEMRKLGYILYDDSDGLLEWHGERCEPEKEPSIDTYEDHRMAMAFAPAAIVTGKLSINEPSVVSKSYPGFWNDLKSAGFI
jgi:3-phosphoshikimate 1-carboxyvinyltransferase